METSEISIDEKDPLISIIMNCYNSEKFLVEAIDSVLRQTYKNWELIVWDNASTDQTGNIAQSYNDSRVRYFRGDNNVSLGAARNLAIGQAVGEYISFLDSDDRWLPGKLETQKNWLMDHPGCDFVYTNFYKLMNNGRRRRVGLKGSQPEGNVFRKFLRHYPINLQTVIIRTEKLVSMEVMFDPHLSLSEEYDLFMRLLIDTPIAYINKPLVEYRIHQDMSSIRNIGRYAHESEYVIKKLENSIPDFHIRFAEEVLEINAKLNYYRARDGMAQGNCQLAIEALRPCRNVRFIYRFLFYLSFFGRQPWNLVHWLSGRFAR